MVDAAPLFNIIDEEEDDDIETSMCDYYIIIFVTEEMFCEK